MFFITVSFLLIGFIVVVALRIDRLSACNTEGGDVCRFLRILFVKSLFQRVGIGGVVSHVGLDRLVDQLVDVAFASFLESDISSDLIDVASFFDFIFFLLFSIISPP